MPYPKSAPNALCLVQLVLQGGLEGNTHRPPLLQLYDLNEQQGTFTPRLTWLFTFYYKRGGYYWPCLLYTWRHYANKASGNCDVLSRKTSGMKLKICIFAPSVFLYMVLRRKLWKERSKKDKVTNRHVFSQIFTEFNNKHMSVYSPIEPQCLGDLWNMKSLCT